MTKDKWGPLIPWKQGDHVPTSGMVRRIFDGHNGQVGSGASYPAEPDDYFGETVIGYRMLREPVVEPVRQPVAAYVSVGGTVGVYTPRTTEAANGFLVYDKIDGKPDLTTLRWEVKEGLRREVKE